VERIAEFVKAQGTPAYLDEITKDVDEDMPADAGGKDGAETSLFDQAVAIVSRDRKASTSYVGLRLSAEDGLHVKTVDVFILSLVFSGG